MFKKSTTIVWIFILGLIFSSCSQYQKLVKSADVETKYEAAIEYYNQENYYRALELFESVIPFYRGTDKAEDLYYYYAYCHYKQGDNILASHYFKRFTKSFPNSKYAEECLYMSAYCKYLDSPIYSLDQTSTIEAMLELQLFLDVYPRSEYVEDCESLMVELRKKLEKKYFEIAKLYLKMDYYQSSITAFSNFLEDFPDSQYKEEVLFFLTESYYHYAINSVEDKKKERFLEMLEMYDMFTSLYPESDYVKQADNYYRNSKKYLTN